MFPSLETIHRLASVPPNFLLPPSSTSTPAPSSTSSTSSLDCRSPAPYMFGPFHPLHLSLLENSPMPLFSFLQQQSLLNFSSPSELSQRSFIKCPICLAAFPNTWLLEQHTILQHSGQPSRRHHSPESGGSNSSREDKPFQCDQCGQSYRYRSAYIKHREQNHRARLPADKLFTCDICGMQFRYLKSFRKHRLNHSLEILQPPLGNAFVHHRKELKHGNQSFVAAVLAARGEGEAGGPSGVVSESQVSSSNEVEAQSGAAGTSATATATSKESATESSDSAPTTPASATASTNRASPNSNTLFEMLRLPTQERQRERQLFACSFCSKTVRSKENLKLHVRKHTGERPFACLFCGRAFGGKSDLTRHVRIHTGERPYHCEMCGKCFARADYLSKHLTTHLHNSHSNRSAASSD